MKTSFTTAVVLGAALGLCMLPAPNASAAGLQVNRGITNVTRGIVLDNYCDTFTVNVPSVGSGLPHTLDGVHNLVSTCGSTEDYYDIGYAPGSASRPGGMNITEIEGGILVLYVFKLDGTWANYYDCTGTGTECAYLTGTWHFSAPGAVQNKRPGQRSSLQPIK
ncbi:MAG: hypothetical protein JSS21_02155 [Proteobacteria bacterium]|nr:hypothetical protein [Pseudomonadota bacterium]